MSPIVEKGLGKIFSYHFALLECRKKRPFQTEWPFFSLNVPEFYLFVTEIRKSGHFLLDTEAGLTNRFWFF